MKDTIEKFLISIIRFVINAFAVVGFFWLFLSDVSPLDKDDMIESAKELSAEQLQKALKEVKGE